MAPRSISQLRERERKQWRAKGSPATVILDPAAGECAPLFTSKLPDCLTHITRFVSELPPWPAVGRTKTSYVATGWCGTQMSCRQIELADASGFVCMGCHERATELGLDTFGLIPDSGCAVSGGKRGRNRGRTLAPYSRRESYR